MARYKISVSFTKRMVQLGIVFMILFLAVLWPNLLMAQPGIVTQPVDTSVCEKTSVHFDIIAVNTSSYQWQENDGNGWTNLNATIPYVQGQNTPNLKIIDANLGLDGYKYRCIVSDIDRNELASQAAILHVYEPPIITLNPANVEVCKNEVAVFSVHADNGTGYQWQENTGIGWLSIQDNAFYSGAQTADLSIFTTTGMNDFSYRCIIKHITCPDTTLTAKLHVNPTPDIFSVTGGGEFCQGGEGVKIGMDGSELGISYDLELDGVETGVVLEGTGSALDFGKVTNQGTYTVVAYHSFTGCSVKMNGHAVVVVNALPQDFMVKGGGDACAGEDGPEIILDSSQLDISYSVFLNGQKTGKGCKGTGYSLSFGHFTESGSYTVVALNNQTGCSKQLSGYAQVTINPIPKAIAGDDQHIAKGVSATLKGGGAGGSGNYSYQWKPDELCLLPGRAETETHPLYHSTLFKLTITDNQTSCVGLPDSTIVIVNSGPLQVSISADKNTVCKGDPVSLLGIGQGGTGSYSYLWTSSPPGFQSVQAYPVVNPEKSIVYKLRLSDGQHVVYDSVSIHVNPLPKAFSVLGGGGYCSGGEGLNISLNGSELGTRYSLYKGSEVVGNKDGTGNSLDFGKQTANGIYHVLAENDNGCVRLQSDSIQISIYNLPIADAGPDIHIIADNNATLSAQASGGAGGYSYRWDPADSLLNPLSSSPSTRNLMSTTVFHLKVTDIKGCSSKADDAVVFVSGGPVSLKVVTSDFPVCPGEKVKLIAMASGGNGNFTYLWQSEKSGFLSEQYAPVIFPVMDEWYKVIVNDGFTTVSDSVFIEVTPQPEVFDVSGGGRICQGDEGKTIFLSGSQKDIRYELFRDGLSTGLKKSGTSFPIQFGLQKQKGDYSIRAINVNTGCKADMNSTAKIIVSELPIVDAGPDQSISSGSTALLNGTVSGGSGNYSYSWSPSQYCESPAGNSTRTNTLSQTTFFYFRAIDAKTLCASKRDSLTIYTISNNLYASASASKGLICEGESVDLKASVGGGTGSYTYSWTSKPEGLFAKTDKTSHQPALTTTYYLDVYDGLQHVYDSVKVRVTRFPVAFQIRGGGEICQGDSGLSIGLKGSETGVSYQLFKEPEEYLNTQTGNGSILDFGKFSDAGNYYIVASNKNACTSRMQGEATIKINPLPQVNAGLNEEISFGAQAKLSATVKGGSGHYIYTWSPADSLLNPNDQNPVSHPLHQTNVFSLTAKDAVTKCAGPSDRLVVFVKGGPMQLHLEQSKPAVCPEEEAQLFALVSGGSGNYSFRWTSNPYGFESNVYNPKISSLVTTTYIVTVGDGIEQVTDSIKLVVKASPVKFHLSGGGSVCIGDEPDAIVLSGSEVNTAYSLLNNGLPTSLHLDGNGFKLDFGIWKGRGNYTVIATNVQSSCSDTMNGTAVVNIYDKPVVNAGTDQIIKVGKQAVLQAAVIGGSGAYTYQWQPASSVENPQFQTTQTKSLNESKFFVFEATDAQTYCHSALDTVVVYVSGKELKVKADADKEQICEQTNVKLFALASGGTGNYSYQWLSQPAGFSSLNQNPNVRPTETTWYFVDVFDGNQHARDSVLLSVSGYPSVYNVTGGGTYCLGQQGVLVGLNGSESGVRYDLFKEPGTAVIQSLVGNGRDLNFGEYTESGNYFVKALKQNVCKQQMNGTAIIHTAQIPKAYAGDDQTIAYGGQVALQASADGGSGFYDFSWNPADSLVDATLAGTLTKSLHESTLFNLKVTDKQTGCMGTEDQTVVFVKGGPLRLKIYASSTSICPGERVKLVAMASGGSSNYRYLWLSEPASFSSEIYNPEVSPKQTTTYKLMLNDGSSLLTDSVTIQVKPAPKRFSLQGGGSYCQGEDGLDLQLSGSEAGVSYELFSSKGETGESALGDGSVIDWGNKKVSASYWVIAQLTASGCSRAMNDTVRVNELESPEAVAGTDAYISAGSTVLLNGNARGGSGNYSFYWSPEFYVQNSSQKNTLTIALENTRTFMLNVKDSQSGCSSATDSMTVFITGGPLSLDLTTDNKKLCAGQGVHLRALAGGGKGNYKWSWYSKPSGFYAQGAELSVNPKSDTYFFVTLSDGETHLVDSVFIRVYPQPNDYELVGGGSLCENDELGLNLNLSGSDTGVFYRLYRKDLMVKELEGNGNSLDFGSYRNAGTYSVKAFNVQANCERQMSGVAVIAVNPAPVASAGADKTIESGMAVSLDGYASGGSGDYTYVWNPAKFLQNATQAEPTTIALNQGQLFSLQVVDRKTGCKSKEDDVMVFVRNNQQMSVEILTDNHEVCPGSEVKLSVVPTGGNGVYNYYWQSRPEGLLSTDSRIDVYPSQRTWYIVRVQSGNLLVKDSILITTMSLPELFTVNGGGNYCMDGQGPSIGLNGSVQGDVYELFYNASSTGIQHAGTGSEISFGNQRAAGNYSVQATNGQGCSAFMKGMAQVSVSDKPRIFQLEGGGTFCDNDTILGLLLSASETHTRYDLYVDGAFSNTSKDGTGFPLAFTGLNRSGIYTVEAVQNQSGCVSTMNGSPVLMINASPQISISGDTALCSGDSVTLLANGGTEYWWNTNPPQQTPAITVSPVATTSYEVWVTNPQACTNHKSQQVLVYEMPDVSLENNKGNFILTCLPSGMSWYKFYTKSGTLQEGQDNQLFYAKMNLTSDTVFVDVRSTDGCQKTASVFVLTSAPPTAFTPDGDQINDIFMKGYHIIVYDRWGKELYRGDQGWDGNYRGKRVAPGTYYYVNIIYDKDGRVALTKKGSVTLVNK